SWKPAGTRSCSHGRTASIDASPPFSSSTSAGIEQPCCSRSGVEFLSDRKTRCYALPIHGRPSSLASPALRSRAALACPRCIRWPATRFRPQERVGGGGPGQRSRPPRPLGLGQVHPPPMSQPSRRADERHRVLRRARYPLARFTRPAPARRAGDETPVLFEGTVRDNLR